MTTGQGQRPDVRASPAGGEAEDDAAVIRRSRDEPEHFAVLFRRYAPEVQRYVRHRIGADAADDVVAETFLAAFGQRGRYDLEHRSARPWLYGIATNLIGRYRRTEIQQYRALARTGHDPVTEPFTDRIDAAVSAEGTRKQLAAALARLPTVHRDTLLLVVWGDLSYTEAAAALGVPAGTVRSRMNRARKRLRRSLARAGEPAPDGTQAGPRHHQERGEVP
jgi:RNA polymerase sigma factor (sigma-70 family)